MKLGKLKTYRALEPQRRSIVPCIMECEHKRRESKRKAFVESVASVNGK